MMTTTPETGWADAFVWEGRPCEYLLLKIIGSTQVGPSFILRQIMIDCFKGIRRKRGFHASNRQQIKRRASGGDRNQSPIFALRKEG